MFGNSGDGINSRVIPANYTPVNFSPEEVGGEGLDKVSALFKGIDSKLGAVFVPTFTDQVITADGVNSTFLITQNFGAETYIDAHIGMIFKEENIDWSRDVGNNEIQILDDNMNPLVLPVGIKIYVRVFSLGFTNIDEKLTSGSAIIGWTPTNRFDESSYIDVWLNGQRLTEGEDYTRTVGANLINFTETIPPGARLFLRIWSVGFFDENIGTGDGSNFLPVSSILEYSTRMDLYISGILAVEGEDYSRDVPNNRIVITDGSQVNSGSVKIVLRIWV